MANDPLKALLKIDRRAQWKALKAKHKAEIGRAKLDLDLKLGPGLDKYQTQVDKVAKLAATADLTNGDVLPVMRVTTPLFPIVERYQAQVKKLNGPAAKELGAMLTALEAEFQGWDKLASLLPSVRPQAATPAQKAAAKSLVNVLDHVYGQFKNVESRAPRSAIAFKKEGAADVASAADDLLRTGRAVGPDLLVLAREAGQAAKGTNYPLLKTRAQTVASLMESFSEAAQAYLTAVTGRRLTDVDTKALKFYSEDVIRLCGLAREKIAALP